MSVLPKIPTFLSDACCLRAVVQELAPQSTSFVERATLLSGPGLRGLKVFTRMSAPLLYAEQSSGFLRATAQSAAAAQIAFAQEGGGTYVAAHSHPGSGVDGTCASALDWDFMTSLQQGFRAEVIGMIVVRPDSAGIAFVRFFSPTFPFRVIITGWGVTLLQEKGDEYVFALQTHM
jgi:hypothetical protein